MKAINPHTGLFHYLNAPAAAIAYQKYNNPTPPPIPMSTLPPSMPPSYSWRTIPPTDNLEQLCSRYKRRKIHASWWPKRYKRKKYRRY